MVVIKSKSDYVITDNFKPGPKNGHLSEKDPEFVEVEATTVEALAPLWAAEVPLDKFKESWLLAPPALPEGCPEPGRDVFISKMKVPVRDGTQIEIQIYRPSEPRTDAALVFRMHGGGWTVGSHEIEEAENRYLGALPNAVVVSVDYRMSVQKLVTGNTFFSVLTNL
jgi:acetyl esterase/lipase